jgi:hypothetical protein
MVPNGRKPLTIVQDKQKETYTVDLVLVVEEKHTIECPTLMFWGYNPCFSPGLAISPGTASDSFKKEGGWGDGRTMKASYVISFEISRIQSVTYTPFPKS